MENKLTKELLESIWADVLVKNREAIDKAIMDMLLYGPGLIYSSLNEETNEINLNYVPLTRS